MTERPERKRPPRERSGAPQRPGRLPRVPHGSDKQAGIGDKTMIGTASPDAAMKPEAAESTAGLEKGDVILKVLSRGTVSNFKLKADKITTFIGSQRESCDIVVNDPAVSKRQLAIIRYEDCYILADCGVNDLTTFDGVFTRQTVCPMGSTCVINMNMSTLIFDSTGGQLAGRSRPRKRFHLEPQLGEPSPPPASVSLILGDRALQSTIDPILIGSHSECTLPMRGEGIVPFHALVHWSPEGVCVTQLGKGAVAVNSTPIEKAQILNPGDVVHIANESFTIQMDGDIYARCDAMFGGYKLDFNYIRFTAMPHSVCGSFMLPGIGGAVMVGRSSNADITLDDGAVSREHVQLIPNGKSCQVIDNYSANGSFVNNEKVTKARLRSGDLLEVGRSVFVLHYD